MTSKQRAYLKSLAMNADTIMNIGKSSLTPEVCTAVSEALEKRELVKIGVLKNRLRNRHVTGMYRIKCSSENRDCMKLFESHICHLIPGERFSDLSFSSYTTRSSCR